MADDKDEAAQRDEGRQRARAGLPFILDDRRMRPTTRPPPEHDPWEKTAEQMRKNNTDRQAKARRVAAARRRRLLAGDDVEEMLLDAAPVSASERAKVDPARRADTTRDALLERTVHSEPAYARLVALCREEDKRPGQLRSRFVEVYCRELSALRGRPVTEERMAELCAELPAPRSSWWGYDTLKWAYRLFSEWAVTEHIGGHIFTEDEIAPMRVWLQGVERGYADAGPAGLYSSAVWE